MSEDKRLTKADFPKPSDLPVYGKDIPVPTSFDELVCKYNENDRTPPLKLEELEGYCVPPPGIVTVGVNGVGVQAGRAGLIYPAGTFREDRHTIGKELGVTASELNLIREESIRDAAISGIRRALEANEIEIHGTEPADVIETLMAVTLERLLDPEAPVKELRLATFTDILKVVTRKEETVERARENLALELGVESIKTVNDALAYVKEQLEERKGEVVEAELYDVE